MTSWESPQGFGRGRPPAAAACRTPLVGELKLLDRQMLLAIDKLGPKVKGLANVPRPDGQKLRQLARIPVVYGNRRPRILRTWRLIEQGAVPIMYYQNISICGSGSTCVVTLRKPPAARTASTRRHPGDADRRPAAEVWRDRWQPAEVVGQLGCTHDDPVAGGQGSRPAGIATLRTEGRCGETLADAPPPDLGARETDAAQRFKRRVWILPLPKSRPRPLRLAGLSALARGFDTH